MKGKREETELKTRKQMKDGEKEKERRDRQKKGETILRRTENN